MNTSRAEQLIRKYEAGETSLQEERDLKAFFSGENIPEHLLEYKVIFGFYRGESNDHLPDSDFGHKIIAQIHRKEHKEQKNKSSKKHFYYLAVAAGIMILFGIWFLFPNNTHDNGRSLDDPELAYLEVKQILLSVSGNMNAGLDKLSAIQELNESLDALQSLETFDEGVAYFEKFSILGDPQKIKTHLN